MVRGPETDGEATVGSEMPPDDPAGNPGDAPEAREDRETPWYVGRWGPLLLVGYLLLTAVALLVSAREVSFADGLVDIYRAVAVALQPETSGSSVPTTAPNWLSNQSARPSLQTTVPLDVYLFGLAGAFTRFLLSFVVDIAALTAPGRFGSRSEEDGPGAAGDDMDASELELLQLVLGIPAAVYLAAGVFLVGTQITGQLQRFDSPSVFVIVAFIVGFYVKRSYGLLGDVADRLLEPVEEDEEPEQGSMLARTFDLSKPAAADEAADAGGSPEGDGTEEAEAWYTGWPGKLLFGLALLLAFVVLGVILEDGPATGACGDLPCFRVPFDVYLYAVMGGVGYVFTKLFVDVERSRRSIYESSVRILAGVFLAIGFWVLTNPVEGAVAAIAFLVGLYLNVAVVRFDALAEEVLDRLSRAIRSRSNGE